MEPLVVGFDLDMTLIDSRPGVHASFVALIAETGVFIDPDVVVARLGPPLEQEMRALGPRRPGRPTLGPIPRAYAEIGIEGTLALPGATEASGSVRAAGGRRSSSHREVRAERVALPRPRRARGRRRRRLAPWAAEGRDAGRTGRGGLRR